MTPINSINPFLLSSYRFQNKPVTPASSVTRDPITKGVEPTSLNPAPTVSVHQLPEGPAHEISDILRRINTRAHQAAELGLTFENREVLQAKITEDLSTLKTVSSELSQDDLNLFVAIFQNQLLVGPAYSDTSQDRFIPNPSLDGLLESFPESFFRIDVTSALGSLAALDLTGTALDILSVRNSGAGLLESLLDNLTDSIFNFRFTGGYEQYQDDTPTDQDRNFAHFLARAPYFNPAPPGSNPPTIIDLVG
jgi:hypothetical protein